MQLSTTSVSTTRASMRAIISGTREDISGRHYSYATMHAYQREMTRLYGSDVIDNNV